MKLPLDLQTPPVKSRGDPREPVEISRDGRGLPISTRATGPKYSIFSRTHTDRRTIQPACPAAHARVDFKLEVLGANRPGIPSLTLAPRLRDDGRGHGHPDDGIHSSSKRHRAHRRCSWLQPRSRDRVLRASPGKPGAGRGYAGEARAQRPRRICPDLTMPPKVP
jgi:hypothetical protein